AALRGPSPAQIAGITTGRTESRNSPASTMLVMVNGTRLSPAYATAEAAAKPRRAMRFSQRLSDDHLVLELHEDEDGFGDVADRGRANADVLHGAPALLHQGEAAFALVAQGSEQRVTGFRVDVEFAVAGLSHRDEHAGPGAFEAG